MLSGGAIPSTAFYGRVAFSLLALLSRLVFLDGWDDFLA